MNNLFKNQNGMNVVGQGGKIILYAGVMIFIGVEEKQLNQVFGKEYVDYTARVDRLIPFKKP
jgi:protein-S-isoprenylcysteine O-methyltransferase Ste14